MLHGDCRRVIDCLTPVASCQTTPEQARLFGCGCRQQSSLTARGIRRAAKMKDGVCACAMQLLVQLQPCPPEQRKPKPGFRAACPNVTRARNRLMMPASSSEKVNAPYIPWAHM